MLEPCKSWCEYLNLLKNPPKKNTCNLQNNALLWQPMPVMLYFYQNGWGVLLLAIAFYCVYEQKKQLRGAFKIHFQKKNFPLSKRQKIWTLNFSQNCSQ